jgi:hypothetical protein
MIWNGHAALAARTYALHIVLAYDGRGCGAVGGRFAEEEDARARGWANSACGGLRRVSCGYLAHDDFVLTSRLIDDSRIPTEASGSSRIAVRFLLILYLRL